MLSARIVLLGAESTGTTTVAVALAERLRTRSGPWADTMVVEEYGPTLTERKQQLAATPDGGAHLRAAMTDDFLAHLIPHDKPFAVLTGTPGQRLGLAERITDQAVRRRLTFAPPI